MSWANTLGCVLRPESEVLLALLLVSLTDHAHKTLEAKKYSMLLTNFK